MLWYIENIIHKPTEEATCLNFETFLTKKKEIQLTWFNFQIIKHMLDVASPHTLESVLRIKSLQMPGSYSHCCSKRQLKNTVSLQLFVFH